MAGTLPNRTIDISSVVPGLDGKVRPHDPLGLQGGGLRYLLDDFSYSSIPIIRTDGGGFNWPLWYNNCNIAGAGFRDGTDSIAMTAGPNLSNALRCSMPVTGANYAQQMLYYNNSNNPATGLGGTNYWRYLNEAVGNAELGRINRLRFWIKTTGGYASTDHNFNYHFGTYRRAGSFGNGMYSASRTTNETDNMHFYHYYNIGADGWTQVIVDVHPHHQRSRSDQSDIGPILAGTITGAPNGGTYFDDMTYFYIQNTFQTLYSSTVIDHAGFEMYEESGDDDLDNIYGLSAVKSDIVANKIRVAWSCSKQDANATFDLRFSFSSFRKSGAGFSHGDPIPGGTGVLRKAPGGGAYNGCFFETTAISFGSNDVLWVAIQRQGQSRYREIGIPLTDAGYSIVTGGVF